MSSALVKAAPLKADIRLAQAVSSFEADLSTDQKKALRDYQAQSREALPYIHDVMQLTARIDRGGGRCFGPRLTNVLQSVQQFAALGDVIVGASQSIIACAVWSLVRMSLLVRLFSGLVSPLQLTLFSGWSTSLPASKRCRLFSWSSAARLPVTKTWPCSIPDLRICNRTCLNTSS
jgi:hypothetical protein